MKLKRALIKDFRKIKELELDFTDSLGVVRNTMAIAGPNTSGKTTILDALALALGQNTERVTDYKRPELYISSLSIVRSGSLRAEVHCTVTFTDEEIEATRELLRSAEEDYHKVPSNNEVEIVWRYPDQRTNDDRYGWYDCKPEEGWRLFKGRSRAARLLSTRILTNTDYFKKVGGVFTFDQQRTGLGKMIPPSILQTIRPNEENGLNNRYTKDPREILLSLALIANTPSIEPSEEQSDFERIQARYADIASPHKLIGVQHNRLNELMLLFSDGINQYNYGGMSSGEEMLLLFLIRFVTSNIHRSIVFVDELELHQHPFWQRKLLHTLPKLGIDNQIIYTTHSPFLRDAINPDALINLGELNERLQGALP